MLRKESQLNKMKRLSEFWGLMPKGLKKSLTNNIIDALTLLKLEKKKSKSKMRKVNKKNKRTIIELKTMKLKTVKLRVMSKVIKKKRFLILVAPSNLI